MRENQEIKDEVMRTERFKEADTLARTREAKRRSQKM